MPILLAHVGTLVDEDTGSKLVVGLGGKEERGGGFVVQDVHVGTKGQQHLQHISGSTQAGSIVQGTEPTHQTAGSYVHPQLPHHLNTQHTGVLTGTGGDAHGQLLWPSPAWLCTVLRVHHICPQNQWRLTCIKTYARLCDDKFDGLAGDWAGQS